MAELTACPVCGGELSHRIPYLNIAYAQHAEFQGLEIAVCPGCGLGLVVPEITYRELQEFYQKLYRAPGSVHQAAAGPLMSKYSFSPRALSQWMLLKTFGAFKRGDGFLDIGPGGGATFQTARLLHLDLTMFAYEPDESSIAGLKELGVTVFPEDFTPQPPAPEAKFSCILMSHVLEHFSASDALGVLKKIKVMLAAKGVFLCEVPNAPMARYGHLRLDDSPHLTFWSKESLAKAMAAAGLKILFLDGAGEVYQDWYARMTTRPAGGHRPGWKAAILNYCPRPVLDRLFVIYSWLKHKSVYDCLSANDFQYGEDRVYLRAVCSL
jgi:SAM-dependent methyltransferase